MYLYHHLAGDLAAIQALRRISSALSGLRGKPTALAQDLRKIMDENPCTVVLDELKSTHVGFIKLNFGVS